MPDPSYLLSVGEELESSGRALDSQFGHHVTSVRTAEEGLETLSRTDVDCIVSTLEAADADSMDGIAFCRTVRERDPTVPFVLVVDSEETDRISDAIAAGVTDFQVRSTDSDGIAALGPRIELALSRGRSTGDGAVNGVDSASAAEPHPASPASTVDPSPGAETLLGALDCDRDRYRQFVDRIADPVYVLDETGVCLLVNDALLEYTGYERTQLEGNRIDAFVDDHDYERATETIQTLYDRDDERRANVEVTIQSANDEPRNGEVHVTVVTDDAGGYAGSVGVIRDITERKRRIRELDQYEAIVETAPIGLLVVDEDGLIRWHNEEFTADLGITGRDLEGAAFAALTTDGFFPDATLESYQERVRHLLSSANDDGQVSFEQRWVDADGEEGITDVNMGLLPLEDGEFSGTVYAFRNVTERVQYQQELERQNDRLEKFASLVSHDLRNPLNVAQGHLELLETECESDAIEETRWAIDRMEELIDDLLALARYGRTVADRERIELADLADVAWAGVDTAEATLVTDLEGTITGHEGRVRELLENLFRNAIEHGGEDVTVTVGRIDGDGDGSGADTGFFVADNGSGLPSTGDIFEFGHTTTEEGTGFGLGIVAEIADAHGWQVSARTSADGGARFEIHDVSTLESEPSAE